MAESSATEFHQLVDDYYRNLYRFAYSLSKNPADSSDLVQQTFAIYAEKSDTLRDPSKAKSWLFTTLYHEFLRQKKQHTRLTPQEPELLELQSPAHDPQMENLIDAKVVIAALADIDEIYRAPLSLFYLKSFSYKEIASILNIPIGTVMSRISRGKALLKDALLPSKPI